MIRYAIPSRARAETLVSKTLPLLTRLGVADGLVDVFVAEEEIATYRETLTAGGYPGVKVREGAVGMAAQRNAIHAAYPEGARLIQIDDDLRDLLIADDPETLRPIEPDEWTEVVEVGFEVIDDLDARLWGLYPVPNPYFMRRRISTRLRYIGGGLWGCVNRRDGVLDVSLEDKEDFERSLKCYVADGAVVRFDYVSWRTEGYHGAGGMQADGLRTNERIDESARLLAERYPDLATVNTTKRSGKTELRLADRRPA